MNASLDMTSENNLTSLTSDENYLHELSFQTFTKLLPTVSFVAVLIAVGCPGNLLVFVIYFRYFRRSATRVFVLAMSVCDFFVVSVCLPLQVVFMRSLFSAGDAHACAALYVLEKVAILMSDWLLVCVALDRYRRVCQPMKQQLSHAQACWLLLLPVAVAGLVNFPFVHLYGLRTMATERNGTCSRVCGVRDEFAKTTFATVHIASMMGSLLLGVIFLVVCYSRLLHNVQLLKRRRREMTLRFFYKPGESKSRFSHKPGKDKSGTQAALSVEGSGSEDRVTSGPTDCSSSEKQARKTNRCDLHCQKSQLKKLERTFNENRSCCAENDTSSRESTNEANNGLKNNLNSLGCWELPEPSINKGDAPQKSGNGGSYLKSSTDSSPEKDEDLTSTVAPAVGKGDRDCCRHNAEDQRESRFRTGVVAPPTGQRHLSDKKLYSKTTATMLVLTSTFVVSFIPYFIIIVTPVTTLSLLRNPLHLNLFWIGHLFLNINSVVNPFIYSFVNPKFRRQCRGVLESLWKT